MQKTQELLLILSSEERDAAEEFINRKLKLMDSEQVQDLELVALAARNPLEKIRQNSTKFDGSSRAGKMMVQIYNSALSGLAQLIKDFNRFSSAEEQEKGKPTSGAGKQEEGEGRASVGNLEIEIKLEDEEYAMTVIESSIVDMPTSEIRELRDASEELLRWWQSEGGMHDSLHINQWGDINTANGRMSIRKAREDSQAEEIGPFRAFFQNINLIYQKKNQETKRIDRAQRLREEAGLQ
jgi:hypothetical protein